MTENTQQVSAPTSLPQSSTPPVVDVPVQSSPNSRNRIIVVGIGIFILLFLVGLIFWKIKIAGKYAFSINNQNIQRSSVQDMYNYYIKESRNDRNKALDSILSLEKEHYILAAEFKRNNLSDKDLQQKVMSLTSQQNNDIPRAIQTLAIENNAMQQLLTKKLGIKERSGDAWVTFVSAPSSDQFGSTSAFLKQRLSFYKSQIDTGAIYDQVKQVFLQDQQINDFTTYKPKILSFIDMTPNHPFLPGEDFVQKTFLTPAKKTSEIFQTVYNGILLNGFTYITDGQDGTIANYQKWLADKEESLQVVTDFTAIK